MALAMRTTLPSASTAKVRRLRPTGMHPRHGSPPAAVSAFCLAPTAAAARGPRDPLLGRASRVPAQAGKRRIGAPHARVLPSSLGLHPARALRRRWRQSQSRWV